MDPPYQASIDLNRCAGDVARPRRGQEDDGVGDREQPDGEEPVALLLGGDQAAGDPNQGSDAIWSHRSYANAGFPAPLGPTIATILPAGTVKEIEENPKFGKFMQEVGPVLGKVRELLLFLLLHERVTKEEIGLALWPDSSSAQVRNAFHVTLHHLRRQLGPERWIVFDRNSYRLDRAPSPDVALDADVDERNCVQVHVAPRPLILDRT